MGHCRPLQNFDRNLFLLELFFILYMQEKFCEHTFFDDTAILHPRFADFTA